MTEEFSMSAAFQRPLSDWSSNERCDLLMCVTLTLYALARQPSGRNRPS